MKLLYSIILLIATATIAAAQSSSGDPNAGGVPISSGLISRLLIEVRTNHPSLKAADSLTRAARFGVEAVRIWEDPTVTFGGSLYASRGMNPAEEGNLAYGVEQRLPLWGRPHAAKAVATAELGGKEAEADYRLRVLRRDLTGTLVDAALAERLLAIAEQDLVWLEATAKAVENRYRNGTAALADTLQIQNEVSQRANSLRSDRLHLAHYHLALNRLLGRPASNSWPVFQLPAVMPSVPYSARLLHLAFSNEPRLKVQDWQVRQAAASAEATYKMRFPDVSLGVEGRQFSDDGGFRSGMMTVRLSFPWFNRAKYQKDYERDLSKKQAAEHIREDLEQTVREEVHHLTVDVDNSRREALLYSEEIAVRAEQALSSRLVEWETGKGMLRDVFEARRMALDAQSMAARATAEQRHMLAELLLATGLETFEELAPLAQEPALFSHDDEHSGHAH